MEQSQYLTDTNAIIDYLGKKLQTHAMDFMNSIVDEVPNVSVITKIELLGFNTPEPHDKLLTEFMNDANVIALIHDIVEESIAIRKANKIKLPDAIIAATAIVHGLTLITHNTKDFKDIAGLKSLTHIK
jgi:toxin FitB